MSRLVVLGSCAAWPEPDRACSGYLVEHEGRRIVLDLGYGTLPRLLRLLDSTSGDGLDAVVVTHAHADHVVDVHGLFRARRYSRRSAAPIPLYAADGVVRLLVELEGGDADAVADVFTVHPLPTDPQPIGPFVLRSWAVPHYVPAVAVRLSSPALTIAYSGDTGPTPLLAEVGRDADLFVVEATDWTAPPGDDGPAYDLTAVQAGAAATAAGARRLLLTHFWPGNDRDAAAAAAATTFDGEILVADEGLSIELP